MRNYLIIMLVVLMVVASLAPVLPVAAAGPGFAPRSPALMAAAMGRGGQWHGRVGPDFDRHFGPRSYGPRFGFGFGFGPFYPYGVAPYPYPYYPPYGPSYCNPYGSPYGPYGYAPGYGPQVCYYGD